HRPDWHDGRISNRILQRLALYVFLLYEIEQHDDVTYDQPDQADDSQKGHKPEWCSHDPECGQSAHNSVRHCREDYKRLDSIFELIHQTEKYRANGNQQDDDQIFESLDLLLLRSADLHLVTGRQLIREGC